MEWVRDGRVREGGGKEEGRKKDGNTERERLGEGGREGQKR